MSQMPKERNGQFGDEGVRRVKKKDTENKIIFKKGETETIITNTMISLSAPQVEIKEERAAVPRTQRR